MIAFGPIPSRRLGKSLGINNIISPKTCSYGCIYCQVGRTFKRSISRESFFDPGYILEHVSMHMEQLEKQSRPDYLTLVSNGEPTLDINLGKLIALLKTTGIPVAVITNSSLLFDKSVREDLYLADWVSLKADTAEEITWKRINRPAPGLHFDEQVKSLVDFSSGYSGILRTESMIVDGVNDSDADFSSLAGLIKEINPGTAYISIPTRPPAKNWVTPPCIDKLNRAWQIFNSMEIKTELLTGFEGSDTGFTGNIYEDILNITAVHPLREDTLIELLEKDNAEYSVVESLINQRLIRSIIYRDKKFFLRDYHFNYQL